MKMGFIYNIFNAVYGGEYVKGLDMLKFMMLFNSLYGNSFYNSMPINNTKVKKFKNNKVINENEKDILARYRSKKRGKESETKKRNHKRRNKRVV